MSGDDDGAPPAVDVLTPTTWQLSPVQTLAGLVPTGIWAPSSSCQCVWRPVCTPCYLPATPSAPLFAMPATPSASFFAILSPRFARHPQPLALELIAEDGGGGECDDDSADPAALALPLALPPLPLPEPAPAPARTTPRGATNVRRHLRVPSAVSTVSGEDEGGGAE